MRSFGPWRPEKRVARSTMEQMRMLHKEFPDKYDVKALSAQYNISFEAVRRILHSSFEPTPEIAERQEKRRQEQRDTYVTDLMNKRREGEREKRYQTSSDSQSTDRYSRDNDRYSRGNDKYSRDNDNTRETMIDTREIMIDIREIIMATIGMIRDQHHGVKANFQSLI
ncbi:hypothetical protein BDF19DRAFT_276907 [Syncephalis fuscata]|nr:hypothetical protein BDF19DRAFT_276907 [Syncephalis fuscata]